MIYSISDISKKMDIEERTLKYYAKEGLLPLVEKSASGVLKFKASDFEWLELLTGLRKTGASLTEMKEFAKFYTNPAKDNKKITEMLSVYKVNAEKRLVEFENHIVTISKFLDKEEAEINLKKAQQENPEPEKKSNRKEALVKNFASLVLNRNN